MFVLKNAWSAMGRRKVRTALLALVAVVVSFGSVVGLSVLGAEHTATTTTYNKLSPAVTFRPDYERITMRAGGADKVDWTRYRISWSQYADYVQKSKVELANAYSAETSAVTADGVRPVKDGGQIAITGFSDANAEKNAVNGPFTITSGKRLAYSESATSTVLVPQALAERNNLKVGDSIKLTNPNDASQSQSMAIAGIYRNTDAPKRTTSVFAPDDTIYANAYTTSSIGLAATGDGTETVSDLDVTMVLQSPADFAKFERNVRKAGLSRDFVVRSATIDDYNAKIAPLKRLASETRIGLAALGVAGGVVALLLAFVGLRRRTDEVGFLRTIGVGRGRIGGQFALEMLLPTLVGWVVGTAVGALGAKPLSNALATAANAAPTPSIIWHVTWIGLIVLAVAIALGVIAANAVKTRTILAPRTEETR